MSTRWTPIHGTKNPYSTKQERVKQSRAFDKLIKTTPTLDIKGLKKKGKETYESKIAKENHLLDAFEGNRVKSKSAIKEATRIKKEREAARKKREDAKHKAE